MDGILRGAITRGGFGPQQIADGLWRVQGNPARMNVYLIEDEGELVMFDSGGRCMVEQLRAAVAQIGLPLREVVLSHGHTDHRGSAPFLGVPVRCHPDEVADAQGSGGYRYWRFDRLPAAQAWLHRRVLHPRFWDGGPVAIASTVSEGDTVAGFEVVHIPGHAPGQIALVRSSDGVALTADAFYVIDWLARDDAPHPPMAAYNLDGDGARAAIRKLATRDDITVCWPGHAEALRGNVSAQLLAAADA